MMEEAVATATALAAATTANPAPLTATSDGTTALASTAPQSSGRDQTRAVDSDDLEADGSASEVTAADGKRAASPAELRKLKRTGVLTAVAIGLHNVCCVSRPCVHATRLSHPPLSSPPTAAQFPEGLATFVSILVAPSVGVPVAIAIAAHNIPEGICVAMPVFYATGSRWKGFWLAFLSGLAEPVGALLGYIILVLLETAIHEAANGVLFGFVAGVGWDVGGGGDRGLAPERER